MIPGANGRTFTPFRTGIYKVQVNDFSCIDFSGCYAFVLTDINVELYSEIKIYPNPSVNQFQIEIPNELKISNVRLLSMTGSEFTKLDPNNFDAPVNTSSLSPRVYYVNIEGKSFNKNIKLIIE